MSKLIEKSKQTTEGKAGEQTTSSFAGVAFLLLLLLLLYPTNLHNGSGGSMGPDAAVNSTEIIGAGYD